MVDPSSEVELHTGPSVFNNRLALSLRLLSSPVPVHEQRHLYGQVALQVSALGQTPEARNGVTLQGARSPEDLARDWSEVFGIIARTLWHGDCVVVHCMAGPEQRS